MNASLAAPAPVRERRKQVLQAAQPPDAPAPSHRWLGWAPWLLVAAACIFGLVTMSAELTIVQPLNDESLHFEMVRWARSGQSMEPTDSRLHLGHGG